ncbi:hypothetical protein [Desulfobacula sp.]|uniref:hypothetical protein n=1 Tax=Desulfobacula sp. TaxID=2593537 RepID=UPI00260DB232|nr:hypothetical protein [Desulfobacula sp.]
MIVLLSSGYWILFPMEQQETLVRKPVNLTSLVNRVLNDYTELLAAKTIANEPRQLITASVFFP